MPEQIRPPKLENLFQLDGYLRPYEREYVRRYGVFHENLNRIEQVRISEALNLVGQACGESSQIF